MVYIHAFLRKHLCTAFTGSRWSNNFFKTNCKVQTNRYW